MSDCPDRLERLLAPDADDADLAAHLARCPACAARRAEHAALEAALGRLRDPAPPADLIAGAWARIDARAAAAERRVSVGAALAALLASCAAGLALLWLGLWRPDGLATLANADGLLALARYLAHRLPGAAIALFASALAAVVIGSSLALHRLLPAAERS